MHNCENEGTYNIFSGRVSHCKQLFSKMKHYIKHLSLLVW